MNRNSIKYVVTLLMLFTSSLAIAEESATRSYQLPDNGFIKLLVPKSWREEVRQPPDRLPPTIVFTPKTGLSFQVLFTPIFAARQGVVMPTPFEVKKHIEQAADNVKSQAVEKTITIKELKGPAAIGYYFSATDRSPKPSEYKYLTQGMFRVGELAPTFTILTNEEAGSVVADCLTMLKSAVHVQKSP